VNDSIEKFEKKNIENLFRAFPVLKSARKSFVKVWSLLQFVKFYPAFRCKHFIFILMKIN